MNYDIFISYKRKSLAMANNLYYRLTVKGYSAFFDLEEMRKDNFDTQILNHIENSKDVFVILEDGSLDACKGENWEKDWFCREIVHALECNKNIIPILVNGYKMPLEEELPDKLKGLVLKNAPEFSFSFFEQYLDNLKTKGYITSECHINNLSASVFKFYSNENCRVSMDGKLVCSLEGRSDEPYYLPVSKKGDYLFKCENSITQKQMILNEHIDADEERIVNIIWEYDGPGRVYSQVTEVSEDVCSVELKGLRFNMIRVEGGPLEIGATHEQEIFAEKHEYPVRIINPDTFYIGEFPVTQDVWEAVMGYNKSVFKDMESDVHESSSHKMADSAIGRIFSGHFRGIKTHADVIIRNNRGHYPVENVSYDDAQEFVRRLSMMTDVEFVLPTEEEWEYAARGGQKSHNFIYAGSNDIDEVAWYRDNSDGHTHPVGLKKPNELGLYDMSGNVWEWTETKAQMHVFSLIPSGNRIIRRGGSWWHESQNCRVSKRYYISRMERTSGLGLRVIIRKNIR